jgi:serine/threonine protein kinase
MSKFGNVEGKPPVFARDRSGTHVYQGCEIPFDDALPPMTSKDFMPNDVYATGYIMLRILSGHDCSDFGLKHSQVNTVEAWRALGNAPLSVIWSDYLGKDARSEPPAESWLLAAVDLAMGLVRSDPCARLTCAQALKHPFFAVAE